MSKWFCYVLENGNGKTYNGSTNNVVRRLRQHNGDIKGGAKYTTRNGQWTAYFLMTGFVDHINCLQCEWKIKYPIGRSRKYRSVEGRIKGINDVIKLNRWTNNSIINNDDVTYTIWIVKNYAHLLHSYPDNYIVNVVDVIDNNLLQLIV